MRLLLFLLFISTLGAEVPVAYQGRFRPLDVNAQEATLEMLPDRFVVSHWHPLNELQDSKGNFTAYPDEIYQRLRAAYLQGDRQELHKTLEEAYASLEGKPYEEGSTNTLYFPTQGQLQAESFYTRYPLILGCIVLYSAALLAFVLSAKRTALVLMLSAFALHTFILALRCYILGRPPVSNMQETIIYVPWISVLASLLLRLIFKNSLVLACACLLAVALLIILRTSGLNPALENVQAVLNSQYWLTVHVLMVVGSYGIFLLSGILGHFYLIRNNEETAKLILQTLYVGVALLIPGTILGGVWAAQSWGRFWDWDPKEAWAFISICVYLIVIHAYTFHRISYFGLAVGAILGFQAILFTWYGVNYILGTGLHSYGFGNGGEIYYYIFAALDICFLIGIWILRKKRVAKNY